MFTQIPCLLDEIINRKVRIDVVTCHKDPKTNKNL